MPKPTVLYHTDQASKTRQAILRIAMDIASAEGLEGLSIGRLATELDMSKTGIFAHFGSKEQLQLATIDAAKQVFLEQIVQPALKRPRGVRRLRAMLEGWIGYVERIVFRGGCFFAAASAEFDSRPGPVRDEIASLTKAWLIALRDEIMFARSIGEVSAAVDPFQTAFELHAFVQEANWAFKLFNDKNAFLHARRAITVHLASISRKSAGRKKFERRKVNT
jgi:AcrR family transcriptional regulator